MILEAEKPIVWFKDEKLGIDIKLAQNDIDLINQRLAKGILVGEIKGHEYEVKVSFSLNCSGSFETITPNMRRAIINRLLNYDVALHYTTSHTTCFYTGVDEGFRMSCKDLLSLCQYIKKEGRTSYITVDIHTKLVWDKKEY